MGKFISTTKVAYTWDFDVRMGDDSYLQEGKLGKTWKHVRVEMHDSLLTKKKTIRINDKELVSKEVW